MVRASHSARQEAESVFDHFLEVRSQVAVPETTHRVLSALAQK